MFVQLMRSNQRWLMIILAGLAIVSLVFFYSNRTQLDRSVSDKVGKIYGRTLTTDELGRIERQLDTAHDLRLYEMNNLVNGDGMEEGEAPINDLVLAHEAGALGILPTNDEVRDAEMRLPVFQGTGGAFDPAKYASFVDEKLTPRGFSDTQLDELIRRNLQFAKLRDIVEAGVTLSPADVRLAYEEHFSKTDAGVVRFVAADFAAKVPEPTPEEIKRYYDEQKDRLVQPERRKVQYVKFALDDAQQKLTGKARLDALKPNADRAVDLLDKLEEQKGKLDFAAVAGSEKVPVQETGEFEEGQTAPLPEAAIPGFVEGAFRLTAKDPNSDVPLEAPSPQSPDSYYVLHLSAVVPQRQLTLEEARTKIIASIKDERSRAALAAKAEEVRAKMADALKAGRSLVDAAKAAGETAQEVAPFSRAEPIKGQADGAQISEAAAELAEGELSKFVPTTDGGLLVYVRGREPADEKRFDLQKDQVTAGMRRQKASVYFSEWLRDRRDAANVQIDPRARG